MENIISIDRFQEIISQYKKIDPILVVGDIGIDKYTFGEVKRISPEAPVPILEVTNEWFKLGLAANISHNLKTLDIESTLCGVIGTDQNASRFESLCEESNLKTWGLVRSDDRPTTFKERVTTNTQQICRIDYEKNRPLREDVEKQFLRRVKDFSSQHGSIILEDYFKGTLTPSILQGLIQFFKEKKKLVAIDPGRFTSPELYKNASLIKPNLAESIIMAEALSSREKDPRQLALFLADRLCIDKIVITLGGQGMVLLDTLGDGVVHHIPTVANEVYDVSGAGDTAISLLTASLEAGATLKEAAWIGNCGAGVVVAKKGTATVNQSELMSFYQKLSAKY